MIPILQVRDVLCKLVRWTGQEQLANDGKSKVLSPNSLTLKTVL